jgi:hypothetical protein
VIHALTLLAATVTMVAGIVMLFLTAWVVSLAFRANRTADSRRRRTGVSRRQAPT